MTAKQSGDKMLPHILKLGAWAVKPLIHELPKLDASKTRIMFINGEEDWMNIPSFHDTAIVKLENKGFTIEDHFTPGKHHMYLDHPEPFLEPVLNFLLK